MSIAKSVKGKFLDFEFWLHHKKLARKKGHFSNFDEQKIIAKYITQFNIAEQSKTVVDIGAGNGIRMSNTYALFMSGWSGVGIEYDSRKATQLADAYKFYPNAFACRCLVTPLNVVSLLRGFSIEKNFGVLSLDIDSYDLDVLDAVLSEFRPRLVVSEINEKIPPPIKFSVNYAPDFELRNHFYGYSLASIDELLKKHNYSILELEYNNVFIAPAELCNTESLEISEAYKQGYLERTDRKEKFRFNDNMEILHSLSPEEGIEFIKQFYAESAGKYRIGLE